MKMSDAGRAATKAFESCRLTPYLDQGGKLTVGWGHLLGPGESREPITQAVADALFDFDMMHFEDEVSDLVKVELREHEADAVLMFAYNCGHEALAKSTLLKRLNEENFAAAACEMTKWIHVNSQPSLGLYRRRCAEQAIFLLADYSRAK